MLQNFYNSYIIKCDMLREIYLVARQYRWNLNDICNIESLISCVWINEKSQYSYFIPHSLQLGMKTAFSESAI